MHGLLQKLPITGDIFCFRGESCHTRCSSKQLPGPAYRTLYARYSAEKQHEAWCVALCRLLCFQHSPQQYEEPNPSSFGHLYHAKPDGLQVARQMPYYIYNLLSSRSQGRGVRSWQEQTFLVPSTTPLGCQTELVVLHNAVIIYSKWVVCTEMACEVQSVLSMEPSDSSQSPEGQETQRQRNAIRRNTNISPCV